MSLRRRCGRLGFGEEKGMAAVEDNSMAIGKPIWMKLFMAFYLLHRAKVDVWEDYL